MEGDHFPVLQNEVLKYLDPKENENFIDATSGQGGHLRAILERNGPEGKILGIDLDPEQIENCKLKIKNFQGRIILVCDSFARLKEIVLRERFGPVAGILFDLGLSSWHLEKSGRGFSFLRDEPLIMRYDWPAKKDDLTAAKILNQFSEKEIEMILRRYGQERLGKRIAKKIVAFRRLKPIETTFELVEIIRKAIPKKYHHQRIHFATRTFQALRIAVNQELVNLEKALPQALEVLAEKGRLVVISFHSLEDRIVKNFLKVKEKEGKLKILTKKPIRPSFKEIKINPRSRSARLRAAIKI